MSRPKSNPRGRTITNPYYKNIHCKDNTVHLESKEVEFKSKKRKIPISPSLTVSKSLPSTKLIPNTNVGKATIKSFLT